MFSWIIQGELFTWLLRLAIFCDHTFFNFVLQAIPPTCNGQFDYHIQGIPDNINLNVIKLDNVHGPVTRTVYVNEDAHRIKLIVLHNGNLLWAESIYVPAFGASEKQILKLILQIVCHNLSKQIQS